MVHTTNGTVKWVSGVPSDPQRPYLGKFSHLYNSYHREEGPRESKGKLTLFAHLITREANMDSYIFFLLSTTFKKIIIYFNQPKYIEN